MPRKSKERYPIIKPRRKRKRLTSKKSQRRKISKKTQRKYRRKIKENIRGGSNLEEQVQKILKTLYSKNRYKSEYFVGEILKGQILNEQSTHLGRAISTLLKTPWDEGILQNCVHVNEYIFVIIFTHGILGKSPIERKSPTLNRKTIKSLLNQGEVTIMNSTMEGVCNIVNKGSLENLLKLLCYDISGVELPLNIKKLLDLNQKLNSDSIKNLVNNSPADQKIKELFSSEFSQARMWNYVIFKSEWPECIPSFNNKQFSRKKYSEHKIISIENGIKKEIFGDTQDDVEKYADADVEIEHTYMEEILIYLKDKHPNKKKIIIDFSCNEIAPGGKSYSIKNRSTDLRLFNIGRHDDEIKNIVSDTFEELLKNSGILEGKNLCEISNCINEN